MVSIFWNIVGVILCLVLLASAIKSIITLYATIKTRHIPSIIINMTITIFIILFFIFVMQPAEIIAGIFK